MGERKTMTDASYPVLDHLPLHCRGKVRDVYDLGDKLLLVATDRLSAFDCVLPNAIPGRGKILTQISAFWFEHTRKLVPNHVVTIEPVAIADAIGCDLEDLGDVAGRAMLVHKAERIDFECVVRGYLAGSGWKEYKENHAICGVHLPSGLKKGARLPEPIFTPATKAESGHDENVSFKIMSRTIGEEQAEELRKLSLAIYNKVCEHAAKCGLIVADTKFEFGIIGGQISLIDEVATPDSSRYWDRNAYVRDGCMEQFDKQIVRDWLEDSTWDKSPPAPALPQEVVDTTLARYLGVFKRITRKEPRYL